MISWLWLLPALFMGAMVGMFAIAIVASGARADLEAEIFQLRQELEKCKNQK